MRVFHILYYDQKAPHFSPVSTSSVFSVLFLCPLPLVALRVFTTHNDLSWPAVEVTASPTSHHILLFPEILLNALGKAKGTQENWGRGGAGTLTYNQCWTQHCLLAKLQLHMFYSANNAGDGKREVSTVHGRHFFQPVGHKRCYCLKWRKRKKNRTSHWWQYFLVSLGTGPEEEESLSYSMSGGRFHKQTIRCCPFGFLTAEANYQLGSFALQYTQTQWHSSAF